MAEQKRAPEVLWRPQNAGATPMDRYRTHVNDKFGQDLRTTRDLQRWSVRQPHNFWCDVYDYLEFTPPLPAGTTKAFADSVPMSSNPKWFPGLSFNFTENALFSNPDENATALIGVREDTGQDEIVTWKQFREQVRLTASALRHSGVKRGDRLAALVATSIPAMVLFHASASLGAIFTCISPDLGAEGCYSRLQQVTPKILFADSHTIYKGKRLSTLGKVEDIVKRLDPKPEVYIVPLVGDESYSFGTYSSFLQQAKQEDPLTFEKVAFSDPLMICYSSGTTGAPKCIVHQHGLLVQLKKIAILHNSTTPKDVMLQYSSTSWVVFYVMNGYFASGAATIVYNGSPMFPDTRALLRMIEKYRVTYFGSSPRYLLELELAKVVPKDELDLSSLRIVYTTGATLSPDQYRWFYRSFPKHIHLCNTAGGTDTATSLIAASPTDPIHAGEMQIFALGMDVDIADPATGESILETGEAGEMIMRTPFPSMPCFFWGDDGGSKYFDSYFARYENIDVWAQHDWLQQNPKTGGLVMHGRSDGVLNPSGIRFGSGEIYAIVEAPPFTERISQALCVGRRRPQDSDESVFLFVTMNSGDTLTSELSDAIKNAIKTSLSPRHIPQFVIEVPEIPTTINGKKVEAAVKQTISGKDVDPSNTVINPDAITYFRRFRTLEREARSSKL
ncbi:hypothetical protein CBER1_05323 [Cercospora berteroae]|uniref:Uncharacterized protein n=1 Tax=Cercospora berteroae TaxID=357750 RepID=A0A2S6CHL6_9PEZI|nr:hypothetical protein CBER1_05323 [Cercospora berteroae]